MKTLDALSLARSDIMERMGGDWFGDLVIQPAAGLFSIVAIAASPVEDARLAEVTHIGVAVSDSKLVSTFSDPADFPSPTHWEGEPGIGALRALDIAVKDTDGMQFHEEGEISVRLAHDHYIVTFPFDLEPGTRGPSFAFQIFLNPQNGEIKHRVMGN